jgi:hypothetical protein
MDGYLIAMCKYEKPSQLMSWKVINPSIHFKWMWNNWSFEDQEFAWKITLLEILVHSFAAIDLSFKIQSYRDQDIDNLSLVPVVLLAVLLTVDQVLDPYPDHTPQWQSLQWLCKGTAISSKHWISQL